MVLLEHSEPVQCCHSHVGLHPCGMRATAKCCEHTCLQIDVVFVMRTEPLIRPACTESILPPCSQLSKAPAELISAACLPADLCNLLNACA